MKTESIEVTGNENTVLRFALEERIERLVQCDPGNWQIFVSQTVLDKLDAMNSPARELNEHDQKTADMLETLGEY